MILPYELPPPGANVSAVAQKSMLDKAESWVGTVTDLVEEGQGLIEDPASYAKNFLGSAFKSKMAEVKQGLVEEHLFLYLVDEYNGKPVYDESGVFPHQDRDQERARRQVRNTSQAAGEIGGSRPRPPAQLHASAANL